MTETPRVTVEPGSWAVARLDPGAALPEWTAGDGFCSITRTRDELSIVCPEAAVPAGVRAERGWAMLKLSGPFPFTATGVLSSFLAP
ncbi:MAG TPA: ACT domain-containing protein, partial [Thermoanaerobaculia bacterium]|nr:ACT domain-containing protein [Thermoanaerobaculia bacterium]